MLSVTRNLFLRSRVQPCFKRAFAIQTPAIKLKDPARPMRIDRELPDPNKDVFKKRVAFVVFSVALGASLALIFNYEKTESPVVTNTFYYLRRSPRTKELLGENINFDGLIPWVSGQLNQVQGKINIKFNIRGSNGTLGVVRLVADRENQEQEFLIHKWTLTVDNEEINILEEQDTV